MRQTKLALVALMTGLFIGQPFLAQAGCGCSKLPPELAEVRPNATYAGMDVTLTHPNVQSGQSYDVTFTSGTTGASATVTAVAVTQRDLADSQEKPQVVASVPALPLGPTSISVSLSGQSGVVMAATDEAFTVVQPPLVFSEAVGAASVPDYQAAVSRNGVVYISLDVTDMHLPRTFQAQAVGYPLRFTNDEVVFYNTQGFMMQLLEEGMPGLFAIDTTTGSPDSDTLQYSRHEFNTHFLQHDERQAHAVDPTDPNWHLDGTPHIDHDHLIIAIAGMLGDGSLPAPGATPAFTLALNTQTLFQYGLVGEALVELNSASSIRSYNSQGSTTSAQGDVLSNGTVKLTDGSTIDGDATTFVFQGSSSAVSGEVITATAPAEFLPVDIPTGLEDLGNVTLSSASSLTIGPGSYQLAKLRVTEESELTIQNTDGPVTLYVTGEGTSQAVTVASAGRISVTDPNPEKFAIYVATGTVTIAEEGTFHGVVYAPLSLVQLQSAGVFYGAFVGDTVKVTEESVVHYDTALRSAGSSSGGGEPSGEPDVQPDVIDITRASYSSWRDRLKVYADSDAAPDAQLTVSIEGFVEDAPMTYNASKGRYEYIVSTSMNLDGRQATVASDLGGTDTAVIQ